MHLHPLTAIKAYLVRALFQVQFGNQILFSISWVLTSHPFGQRDVFRKRLGFRRLGLDNLRSQTLEAYLTVYTCNEFPFRFEAQV
jgi:hypothetical protein